MEAAGCVAWPPDNGTIHTRLPNMIDLQRLAPAAGDRLVVVGGCGGIGSALTRAALLNDIRVAVLDLPRSIEENPPPREVAVFPVDATRAGEVEQAFDQAEAALTGINHVVNLAGFIKDLVPIEDLEEADWNEVTDGSVRTTLLCCRAAVRRIKKYEGGSIVNMSTDLAYVGRYGYAAYSAGKAAITSLTRTLAAEVAPGIRVNTVSPAAVATAFLSGGTGRGGSAEGSAMRTRLEDYVKTVPMGRVALAEDIAGPILFLMSDAARYITGQVLHINGGWMMR